MNCHLLFSADDRTGALEVGGLVATTTAPVAVGPHAQSDSCCVVDIASRHLTPADAQTQMAALLSRNAQNRSHKMDAGLRGNWAYEIAVLLEANYKVAVVCSFPDAGRRCLDGVVYIHDLPVLESVFGADPLNAPVSSRPDEVLEDAGVSGDVVVWDANDNEQMRAAAERARAQDRVLVGASGALGAYAETFYGIPTRAPLPIPAPVAVLCGSLNPLSRQQIAAIEQPIIPLSSTQELRLDGAVTVVATDTPPGAISNDDAAQTAARAAAATRAIWAELGTLIVVGGDTAAAVVGDDTLQAIGNVAPGIPACIYDGLCLITKGGGIGQPDTLKVLCARAR